MAQVSVEIVNPNFDEPYIDRVDPFEPEKGPQGVLSVAHGWEIDYIPRLPGEDEKIHRRPEWRAFQGMQKMFVMHGTTKAVLYQSVPVNLGDILSLEVQARYSSIEAGLGLVVGIDPKGNLNPWADSVVWGDWQGETSNEPFHWPNPGDNKISSPRTLTCSAIEAQGPFVTIFLRLENMWPGKDVSAFWMNARLTKTGNGGTGPGPQPGQGDIAAAIDRMTAQFKRIADTLEAA